MADENLLKVAEQKFQSAAEKIAKDLIATCHKQSQTNADRFRAMSDEEQQECVRRFWEIEDFADWLKQPAEEETQPDCTYYQDGHCIGQKLMPECGPQSCDRKKP